VIEKVIEVVLEEVCRRAAADTKKTLDEGWGRDKKARGYS